MLVILVTFGALFLNAGSSPASPVAVLLQHGRWFHAARDTSDQPAGPLFRHDLAGEWARHFRSFDGSSWVANHIADHLPQFLSRIWIVLPLFAGLIAAYWIPFSRIPGPPAFVGAAVALVFSVPVIFAGLLFSLGFRSVATPGAALGANVLGAAIGGLLESLSLLSGMRALLPLTAGIYCVAAIAASQRLRRTSGV